MRRTNPTLIVLLFFLSVFIFFTLSYLFYSEPTHDYTRYMKQWDNILSGMNPWANKSNTYGPIHSYLVYLYQFHWNLPRILFCVLYFISSLYISLRIYKNALMDETTKTIIYIMLFFNPLFWVFGLKFGINDFMMAFFVVFGLIFYRNKFDILAGLFFTVAILTKFMPVVMLPFLIVYRTQKIRFRFLFTLSYLVSSLFILGLSYLSWGDKMLNPLIHVAERKSKVLSIFRFFRGDASPLRLIMNNPNIDWLSIYLCLASLVIFYAISIKYRFNNILSSITAFLLLLTFYKVGHLQFYITPVLLLLLWVSLDYGKIVRIRFVLTSVYLFIIWISFVSFLYIISSKLREARWREILGLPNFLISAFLIIMLIIYQYYNRISIDKSTGPFEDSS